MNIKCSEILAALKADFGALWNCRTLGETLEITTPYLLPNHEFLCVYITMRGSRFIVSDAGKTDALICDELFCPLDSVEGCRDYLLVHHSVKKHASASQVIHYYRDTEKVHLVPSLVFDLGNFVTAYANMAAHTKMHPKEDDEATQQFRGIADEYIRGIVPRSMDVKFSSPLPDVKEARFGAVIASSNRFWLVSYVTGSSTGVFARNIAYAKENIEMAWASKWGPDTIAATVPLLNDGCAGYQRDKLENRLERLQSSSRTHNVLWSTGRNELLSLLG